MDPVGKKESLDQRVLKVHQAALVVKEKLEVWGHKVQQEKKETQEILALRVQEDLLDHLADQELKELSVQRANPEERVSLAFLARRAPGDCTGSRENQVPLARREDPVKMACQVLTDKTDGQVSLDHLGPQDLLDIED